MKIKCWAEMHGSNVNVCVAEVKGYSMFVWQRLKVIQCWCGRG